MKKIFTIRQIVLLLLLLIVAVRFGTIINAFTLLFYFILLLFTDPGIAFGRFSFEMLDYFFSVVGVVTAVVILIASEIKGRSANPLQSKDSFFLRETGRSITFTSLAVIILLICYIFAPLAADTNPEFQKNINVTRLLPPLTSVMEIMSSRNNEENNVDQFLTLKDKVVKKSFNNNIMFADSVINGKQIIYYQKGERHIEDGSQEIVKSKMFLMGTDEFGRDILSRLIYGARVSITVGLLSVLITFILGVLLGFFAGYRGGFVDTFLNRVSDMFLSFPVIFLIILILALFGNSVISVIIVLGFSGWMSLFKIVRSEIISLKRRDYFLTAKLMGTGNLRLIVFEMLPVIAAPVIVNLVFQFGNVILAESALSYLGLGTGGSLPSWGSMIESGQGYLYRAWWMTLFPGLALFLSLFVTNNLGNRIKIMLRKSLILK